MGRALLLNASFEPLCVVSARRAVVLVLKEKAEILERNGAEFRSERSDQLAVSTISAFSLSTSTTARRTVHTLTGS